MQTYFVYQKIVLCIDHSTIYLSIVLKGLAKKVLGVDQREVFPADGRRRGSQMDACLFFQKRIVENREYEILQNVS